MQAILFPLTYVSETVCAALKTCFRRVRIYQPTRRQIPLPLQALSQKGLIDICIPVAGDDNEIEILVKDYRQWAELHQGGVREHFLRQRGSIPFFDDTATAQIKADIKQTARAPEADDPLLNARVFLQIAQAYDLESEEISRKLIAMNQAERNLFKNITGASDAPDRNALRSQTKTGIDSSDYMMPSRILAWAQLFLKDPKFDQAESATVFVTIHRGALEFLIEQAPTAEPVFKVSSIPVSSRLSEGAADWQKEFGRIIDSLSENAGALAADLIARFQGTDPSGLKADLTLYRIPGESPPDFFARCSGRPLQDAKRRLPAEADQTLIGLVEFY